MRSINIVLLRTHAKSRGRREKILRSDDSNRGAQNLCGKEEQARHPTREGRNYLHSELAYFRLLATASRASLSAVRRRSVSRLSHCCLPRARASSIFTRPFLKYIRVGISVRPFCCVLPISLRISSW